MAPDESDEDILFKKGSDFVKKKQFDEALSVFDEITLMDPSNETAWVAKGVVLTHQQKFQDAYTAFNQALLINPSNQKAINNREMVKKYLTSPIQQQPTTVRRSQETEDTTKDRKPFWLGLIGFIFGILASLFLIISGGIIAAFGVNQGQNFVVLGTVAILLCIIGLPGSLVRHKKYGGLIMIITGILILIVIGGFGIITGLLYIIGGVLILHKTDFSIGYYLSMREDTGKKLLFSCVIIFSIILAIGAISSQNNLAPTSRNSGNIPQSGVTPYLSSSAISPQDFSSVTHGSVMTVSKNWDATSQADGIIIYPDLKDSTDKTLQWSDTELPVDVSIYTTKIDSNYQQIKDKLVYSGNGKIFNWKDGNMFMNGGVKVPYTDIHAPSDQNYGITFVKIKLPDGRVIEAEDKFTSLRAQA